MAWAVFVKKFNFDFRPKAAACRQFLPSNAPTLVSRKILDAAIAKGAAKEVPPPKVKTKD